MNNETTGIHFDTLEKICDILECEPGDIVVRRKVKKSKQTAKAV